jgi:dihydroxyacetone kinase
MKHFINERSQLVTEAIDATIALAQGRLARLDGFPATKVVVRTESRVDRSKVAIVSGGGAGHEPAHIGYVGDGLLTAAVSGDVFASPSVDAVLAAIVSVTGPAGCLLIVKNYTGDRLNFGLAAERARALGLAVEMVIVADDIALPDAPHPRGIAGTLFVHKVAGHLARAGEPLAVVKDTAERVARSLASIGLSLTTCTIPGQDAAHARRLGPTEIELGLGIHGEPGALVIPIEPVRELAKKMTAQIEAVLEKRGVTAPVALLVNDLGGVPPIEMAIVVGSVLEVMKHPVALVFGPDRLMTSLDMRGFSISVLPVDATLEEALLSDVGPGAWPRGRRVASMGPIPLPDEVAPKAYVPSTNAARRNVVQNAAEALIGAAAELDRLDAKVGDGDTGTTFATAARTVLADLDALPFADAGALCAALADRLAKVMGGSSGILAAIFLAAAGAEVALLGDPPNWPKALAAGVRRLSEYGGAKLGDRTMLDALIPAVDALEAGGDLARASADARAGAERTASMKKALAGRSSYVPASALSGVPDPGAVAVATIFEALARAAR